MADEGNIISDLNLDSADGDDTAPAAGIISQYVKDLSVENPNAPQSFQWQDAPQIDVQFNIGAVPIEGEVHEVELKIVVTSRADAGVAFAVDLSYCALVGMRNLPESQAHAFLFAEAPRILFPFARAIIAEAVRDAGFAPLMLEPIDFNGLYVQQLSAQGGVGAPPAGHA
ncbi:preprotein translocase subunit SecB [Novosphingobium chloroacetimidivorans]|uniref:Protein-export protein SecB n=1 Tax=Novosphingobium chloroacetimidivorans TaxID=1428314 RepID=A0A7W7KBV8_9SPHN|nr:protein-export chaperone SecB [Novosphingobium chloroacetimidivorans]MBB4859419.1 preprotein translocase subunit SecB [Novosphingobium chloroacetimidivorans]